MVVVGKAAIHLERVHDGDTNVRKPLVLSLSGEAAAKGCAYPPLPLSPLLPPQAQEGTSLIRLVIEDVFRWM